MRVGVRVRVRVGVRVRVRVRVRLPNLPKRVRVGGNESRTVTWLGRRSGFALEVGLGFLFGFEQGLGLG